MIPYIQLVPNLNRQYLLPSLQVGSNTQILVNQPSSQAGLKFWSCVYVNSFLYKFEGLNFLFESLFVCNFFKNFWNLLRMFHLA